MVRSIYAKGAAQHLNPVPNAAVHRGVLVTSGVLGKDPATGDYAPETAEQIRLAFEQLPARPSCTTLPRPSVLA